MAALGNDISHAQHLLELGELVAIPTETVYGLAANALDSKSVVKIFEAKDRPFFDPLIVHVPSLEAARKLITSLSPNAKKLANNFWPGPLTLLLPKTDLVPDTVTAGSDRVGIRCPNHSLTQALLKRLAFPLAAPSANPFGYVSPTTAAHVQDQLGNKISYILDGGPSTIGIESTVIGWDSGVPVIHRLGGISQEQVEKVIGPVQVRSFSSSKPDAPGQLTSHYAPAKKLVLGNLDELIRQYHGKRLGALSFREKKSNVALSFCLSPSGDLAEAAHNLFSMLRLLDGENVDLVLAENVPDVGIGRAINDRLKRAAAS